ncbi:MAG: hypothetical protein IT437_06185 [Phycisphaerales bacterium]|nr:hypothetical protein [Phycisphaerales bacterium]
MHDGGRYEIEGRAGFAAPPPAVTTLTLDPRSPRLPFITLALLDADGRTRLTGAAQVDTGFDGTLGLSEPAARRARVWLWPESAGRVRIWSLVRGSGSLGVTWRLRVGDAMLSAVPTEVVDPPGSPPVVGLGFLRCWSRVVFDFRRGELTLIAHGAADPGASASVPFEWWHPRPPRDAAPAWVEQHGNVTIKVLVGGVAVDAIVDTGVEADLAVPASIAASSPWREAMKADGDIVVRSFLAEHRTPVARLGVPTEIAGWSFGGLRVLVIDDSSFPAGR